MKVFKIALPGRDAKDAHLNELAVDSAYPNPKVSTIANPPHAAIVFINWSSSLSLVADTIKIIYSFPHGYDYVPTVIASYTFDNGSFRNGGILPFQYGGSGMITIDADETNVNIKYLSFIGSAITPFTMQVRFYVFAERGYE